MRKNQATIQQMGGKGNTGKGKGQTSDVAASSKPGKTFTGKNPRRKPDPH